MIKSERGEHMTGFEEIVGHEQIVTHLKSAMKLGKVSHAYILSGEKGCGKKLLADVFAETLQCEKGGTEPCGSCHSCVQAQSGNHPDIIHLMHEKPNSISVDDVRTQIVNDVLIKPYSGKYKIYIVQYRYKFALTDREVYIIQYGFVSEVFRYVLYTDDAVRLLHKRY